MSVRKAEKLYRVFHQFPPREVGEFPPSFYIPDEVYDVGDASVMYYASDKLNPTTGKDEGWVHYYHEHKEGVVLGLTEDRGNSDIIRVPAFIRSTKALCLIGECEGFDYVDHSGEEKWARVKGTAPEWYCTPCGRAMLAVQNLADVIAIAWGGGLHVESRGVVG